MKHLRYLFLLACLLPLFSGCGYKINYSLSGASIPAEAKTFSVAYFPNNAAMVAPILSSTLTEALQDKFSRQTRLQQVNEAGDFAFEGEIVNYMSTTASVSSDDIAQQNRLTITIKVRFTNAIDAAASFNRSFSAFADYPTSTMLTEAEGQLIPEIVDQLATDVFQAAAANW
ncbi:MAG: LptE family protein [Alistipes sp.]